VPSITKKQLNALSRKTRRTKEELVAILVTGPLNQIVQDGDTDLMQAVL